MSLTKFQNQIIEDLKKEFSSINATKYFDSLEDEVTNGPKRFSPETVFDELKEKEDFLDGIAKYNKAKLEVLNNGIRVEVANFKSVWMDHIDIEYEKNFPLSTKDERHIAIKPATVTLWSKEKETGGGRLYSNIYIRVKTEFVKMVLKTGDTAAYKIDKLEYSREEINGQGYDSLDDLVQFCPQVQQSISRLMNVNN